MAETAVYAAAPYDDISTSAGWAWAQIKKGTGADFGQRCSKSGKHGLGESCSIVSSQFIMHALTRPDMLKEIPRHGFRLRYATIDGDIDLSDAAIPVGIAIDDSIIKGALNLTGRHVDQMLSLRNTEVLSGVEATRLSVAGPLVLDSGTFHKAVTITFSNIAGYLDADGATFADTLDLEYAQVGQHVLLTNCHFKAPVMLSSAVVHADVRFSGSTLDKGLLGVQLHVGANVFLKQAIVRQPDDATGKKYSYAGTGVKFSYARITQTLFIQGANLDTVDLSEANVAKLYLRGKENWYPKAILNLRGAHVGELQDDKESWPGSAGDVESIGSVMLEGFAYDRLGSPGEHYA